MKKIKIILTTLIVLFSIVSHAQVGIGTTTPNAALEVVSTTDGLLIPRVALVNTTTVTVLTGTASELVYNTATTGDVTPGFYYLSTATGPWVRLATGGSGWQITGNTDIVNGVNFMGTAAGNNVDVAFRRNNAAAGRIGTTSTSFGVGALTNGANTNSTAFGNNALSVSSGNNNVAIGQDALRNLPTTAQWNTAVGASALGRINSAAAQYNTAVGYEAMFAQTGAISNTTAIGYHALFQNSSNNNTAVGYNALQGNIGAAGNTAVGSGSLNNNSTGANNTALGFESGFEPITGFSNTFIGSQSGKFGTNASNNNAFVGYQAGLFSAGTNNIGMGTYALAAAGGSRNVALGDSSLRVNTGLDNTAVGQNSLRLNASGGRNVAIGKDAGYNNVTNSNNVYIGYEAGRANTTGGNVAIGYQAGSLETTSNKLYISNSATNATTSLIYGEFAPTRILRTNSQFQIGDPTGAGYAFPTIDGNAGETLQTNGNGTVSWVNANPSKSILRTNLSANQVIADTGWQKITFNAVVFDTNSEFDDTTNNRFVATNDGFYQINAGLHTNNQSNNQFYSIGVYVNGTLYQETTGNHFGNGPVHRNINCIIELTASDYVEIFVQNYQTGVEIDSFSTKTFFEVQQIR